MQLKTGVPFPDKGMTSANFASDLPQSPLKRAVLCVKTGQLSFVVSSL